MRSLADWANEQQYTQLSRMSISAGYHELFRFALPALCQEIVRIDGVDVFGRGTSGWGAMIKMLFRLVALFKAGFKQRHELALENLVLRQQVAVLSSQTLDSSIVNTTLFSFNRTNNGNAQNSFADPYAGATNPRSNHLGSGEGREVTGTRKLPRGPCGNNLCILLLVPRPVGG